MRVIRVTQFGRRQDAVRHGFVAGTASWQAERKRAVIETGVSLRAARRDANFGCWKVSCNSSKSGREMNICACPASVATINRAGGPCQSDPEIIVFVSMTSFTRPTLPSGGFDLGCDIGFRYWLPGQRANVIQRLLKFGGSATPAQFRGQQVAQRRGIQQSAGAGLTHQRVRQFQLNRDTHVACAGRRAFSWQQLQSTTTSGMRSITDAKGCLGFDFW